MSNRVAASTPAQPDGGSLASIVSPAAVKRSNSGMKSLGETPLWPMTRFDPESFRTALKSPTSVARLYSCLCARCAHGNHGGKHGK